MRMFLGIADRWRDTSRRLAICAAVLGLHLGLLPWVIDEPPPRPGDAQEPTGDPAAALNLRFVRLRWTTPAAPALARRQTSPRQVAVKTSTLRRRDAPPATPPAVSHEDPATPEKPAAPRGLTLAWPAASAADTGMTDYRAGGRLLEGSLATRPGPRLPGSDVPLVKGLTMIDPREQGVAGAVRALQSLFGVPDTHCVEVDGWRSMSTRELLDHHRSPEEVEQTAERYHCPAPRA